MGMLIDGKWKEDAELVRSDDKGAFDRPDSVFREKVHEDHPTFQPESQRYHLYVSYACPWAHRTLIFRKLKGLEDHINISVVAPEMLKDGWTFNTQSPGATVDHINGFQALHQVYTASDPNVTCRSTVPILWDTKTNQIVNNESSEIIRIFNTSFNKLTGNSEDYCPDSLRSEIDQVNDVVYNTINNGVYRCGFAKTQEAYDEAVEQLFHNLDKIEEKLNTSNYLVGDVVTEADLRLLPTLLRFDLVYYFHFKCNVRPLSSYDNLSRYMKALYLDLGLESTFNSHHVKKHYYYSHETLNPYRIVPSGPKHWLDK
ncbi:MAG: glutathione-dependent reductase [Bdellovibrionaceae bacterium]|nr:glutathione-dependent reductase [Pseudobdellovibrionaceae bacterium]|tara:strand:+ start:113142 stop:114083 length:942 start_codon:yes stop_codon:yes gene_type:complete